MSRTALKTRLLGLAGCCLLGVGVSACSSAGVSENANLIAGKEAFVEKCGSCHVLERAGTQGATGPSLDAAFERALTDGMGRGTVQGVVHDQILHPADVPQDSPAYMPPDLVTGKLARDVAAYVAFAAARGGEDEGQLATAGTPEVEADAPPGKKLFVAGADEAQSCANCHALEDAGTNASTGPDLDEVLAGQSPEQIRQAIVNPSAKLTPGFGDIMPKDYGETLTDKQLKDLVDYLAEQAG